MACNNLGTFALGTDSSNLCYSALTDSLYGSGLSIGSDVYLDSSCLVPYPNSYFSDGNNLYFTNGSSLIEGISGCCPSIYCIHNDTNYDDTYYLAGVYDGDPYFTGQNTSYVIFYSTGETRWCLAQNLGDPCDQFGPYGSTSDCPDFDDTVAYSGVCVTTTTTTDPCLTFDFSAVFDCLVPTTTTTTSTSTTTTTTTTLPPDPCSGVSMTLTKIVIPTTTTTTIPVTTTTTTIDRPCNFSGEVIFNSFTEVIQCANSKRFTDCLTGVNYYTSDLVLISGGTPLENYVYFANINNVEVCVTFDGLFENISGVDTVMLLSEIGPRIDGSCLDCVGNIQPTTTTTTSTSTTTTTTTQPCVPLQYRINNTAPKDPINPIIINITTTDCLGQETTTPLTGGSNSIFCSTTYPSSDNPQNTTIVVVPGTCTP